MKLLTQEVRTDVYEHDGRYIAKATHIPTGQPARSDFCDTYAEAVKQATERLGRKMNKATP